MYPWTEIFAAILLGFQDIHYWCENQISEVHPEALNKTRIDSEAITRVT